MKILAILTFILFLPTYANASQAFHCTVSFNNVEIDQYQLAAQNGDRKSTLIDQENNVIAICLGIDGGKYLNCGSSSGSGRANDPIIVHSEAIVKSSQDYLSYSDFTWGSLSIKCIK
ncbi:MAG: hypothetical protein R3B45_02550 [Bdellovibrionota bacterium]